VRRLRATILRPDPAVAVPLSLPDVVKQDREVEQPRFRTVAWIRRNSSSSFVREEDVAIPAMTLAQRMEWMSTVYT